MNAQKLYNISAKKDAFLAPDLSHCTLPYGSVLYRVQWYCKYLRPSAQTERVLGSSSGDRLTASSFRRGVVHRVFVFSL